MNGAIAVGIAVGALLLFVLMLASGATPALAGTLVIILFVPALLAGLLLQDTILLVIVTVAERFWVYLKQRWREAS